MGVAPGVLSIAPDSAHGYTIRESVEERTAGAMRLWPATLYGTLQRMTEAGLIGAFAAGRTIEALRFDTTVVDLTIDHA